MIKRIAAAALLFASVALLPQASSAAQICTWGGTVADPTGTFWIEAPGVSNTRGVAEPLEFEATGPLAGVGEHCTGTLTINGYFLPGSQCRLFNLWGTVTGVPGVKWFFDQGGAYSVAQFYAPDGKLVGSYGASVVDENIATTLAACNSGPGYTGGEFWATVEFTF